MKLKELYARGITKVRKPGWIQGLHMELKRSGNIYAKFANVFDSGGNFIRSEDTDRLITNDWEEYKK